MQQVQKLFSWLNYYNQYYWYKVSSGTRSAMTITSHSAPFNTGGPGLFGTEIAEPVPTFQFLPCFFSIFFRVAFFHHAQFPRLLEISNRAFESLFCDRRDGAFGVIFHGEILFLFFILFLQNVAILFLRPKLFPALVEHLLHQSIQQANLAYCIS